MINLALNLLLIPQYGMAVAAVATNIAIVTGHIPQRYCPLDRLRSI
nr:hypothetical protein [Halalkalicoccus subterraneus]